MSEISTWFRSLPLFTRTWFGLSVLIPAIGNFGFVNIWNLVFSSREFVYKFQLWRPFTALFFFPFGFPYLMNLYFLYTYSIRLETGLFAGRPADYCFMLLFNFVNIVISALMFDFPLFMNAMVMSIVYIWCQVNKDLIVQFWFGTHFKAAYLPWAICVMQLVMGGSPFLGIVGILVGHLYYFLTYTYPLQYGGRSLIHTPQILNYYFPSTRTFQGGGFAQPHRQESRGRSHNWGAGHTLGQN